MSNGSDRMNFEEEAAGGGLASFSPPITPPVTGAPGPDQYLNTDGIGTVQWTAKPTPAGTTLIPYVTPTTAVAVGATATVSNITLLGVGTVRAGVMRSK